DVCSSDLILRRRARRGRSNLATIRQIHRRRGLIAPHTADTRVDVRMLVRSPVAQDERRILKRVTRLRLLSRETLDQRRLDRLTNRLPVSIPAIEPNRPQSLGHNDHARDLRLRPPLRARQNRLAVHTAARVRVQPVALNDEVADLVVIVQRLALHIARAMSAIRVNPVQNLVTEAANMAVEQGDEPHDLCPRLGSPRTLQRRNAARNGGLLSATRTTELRPLTRRLIRQAKRGE